MTKKNKSKYYVVWVGQKPGIYEKWSDCQVQVVGFPDAKYKSYKTRKEAEAAFLDSSAEHISNSKGYKNNGKEIRENKEIVADSISVDAACSGNPGIMEYRGVHTLSKEEIFLMGPFDEGTNNVGEFLALVHGLALLKKTNNTNTLIYTDSKTAMAWVRNKKVKTTLKATSNNTKIFLLIQRALNWLNNNAYETKIVKWDTKNWGEIPADFGRK